MTGDDTMGPMGLGENAEGVWITSLSLKSHTSKFMNQPKNLGVRPNGENDWEEINQEGGKTGSGVERRSKGKEKVKDKGEGSERVEGLELIVSSWLLRKNGRQKRCNESRKRELKCSGTAKK